MRIQVLVVSWFLLFSALVPSAFCDDRRPDQVRVSTPVYSPRAGTFTPVFGTYTYEVSWQGIPAAEATVSFEQQGNEYRVLTTARTYKGIDLFYRLRYRGEGVVSAIDYSPIKTVMSQTENSRKKSTTITFHNNGEIVSERVKADGEPEVLKFNPNNFTLDPYSAALLARTLEWEVGESKVFDTFNGKSRYLITMTAEEKIKMKVNGQEREVFVISPRVHNLTNDAQNKKFRGARIYVTADNRREVLRIQSKVFIGNVMTDLIAFTPSGKSPEATQVAHENIILVQ